MRSAKDFYSGIPVDIEDMVSIKIDNLSSRTRIQDLEEMFDRYGRIGDIYIPRDQRTGRTRGFAFIRYYRTKDGERAIKEMDGKRVDSSTISVSWAKNERITRQKRYNQDSPRYRRRRSYSSRSQTPSSVERPRYRSRSNTRSISKSKSITRSISRSRSVSKSRTRRRNGS